MSSFQAWQRDARTSEGLARPVDSQNRSTRSSRSPTRVDTAERAYQVPSESDPNSAASFAQPKQRQRLPTRAPLSVVRPLEAQSEPQQTSTRRVVDNITFFKDVLYMWMGMNETDLLFFSASEGVYKLRSGSSSQQDMFESMRDIGACVRNIDTLLRTTSKSFLQQSLKAAIRKQMTSFFFFISTLREREELSYCVLSVAAMKVRSKLLLLQSLLQETEHVKGGELATKLESLHRQGSLRLKDLVHEIYVETMNPLLQMTVQWLTRGDQVDPFVEFFVAVNERIKDSDDSFWTLKYSLRPEMLPVTVPVSAAERIMLVAKNIAFIRRCCRAKDWLMPTAIVEKANIADFDTLPCVVDEALTCSNSAVMKILRENFKLEEFIAVVRAFFLVGNGNFFEVLIQRLDPVLSGMSSHVLLSSIREHFKCALLDCTGVMRHLNTDLFSNLDCELDKDERLTGWQAFGITLSVPPPLNNIFDASAMKTYRRLFKAMLAVKRAEVALKQAWRQSVVLDRIVVRMDRKQPESLAYKDVASAAHLLGMELLHLVSNIWSYYVYEVCMTATSRLQTALTECKSLDDVRSAHNLYLSDLCLYSLLHSDCVDTKRNIDVVLSLSWQYCSTQTYLTSLLERRQGDPAALKAEYLRIGDDVHREVSSLLTTLEEQHLQFDFMHFLQLRLNFNQFYHDNTPLGDTVEF